MRTGPFDAIVLAGGSARRLPGVDKMLLEVGGTRLIDRAVAAVRHAARIVVVGEIRPGIDGVSWTREDPPGGGPVAALAAGLAWVEAPTVVLLAGDLPFVETAHVDRLRRLLDEPAPGMSGSAGPAPDGALYRDAASGRDQLLFSVWRSRSLRSALPVDPHGAPLHRSLAPLTTRRITTAGPWLADCDTPAEVATARRRADGKKAP